ncbi:hypothetical protein [Bradyrhizobium sp. Ec3.3]|uniref:hypothetical protein n=1 Tax=Bradyrhizobium sp. Ec3.3 TaxID=189753 RepID=UPI0012EC0A2F|nr:hypothetical protein [Bradyrhizobium sp. Ec3.3]
MSLKSVAALGLVILAQQTAQSALPVDRLHESFNAAAAKRGGALRMELSRCMKDERSSKAVSCYYTLANGIAIKARAGEANGPVERVEVELPGDKESATRLIRTAGALAVTLIPDLSDPDMKALMQKLSNATENVFGDAYKRLDAFEFRVQIEKDKSTLDKVHL